MRHIRLAATMRHIGLALVLVFIAAPTALAAAEEFALPTGWTGPTHLAFDEQGKLWITLEGSWALGRYDPATRGGNIYSLRVPRVPEGGLGGIDVAPDGSVWVGTSSHLVQLHPNNGTFAEYPVGSPSLVAGDVHVAPDGIVWYALTSSDTLLRVDPRDGNITTFGLPNRPFGPLEFKEEPAGGFYLTATYGNTYARYDPASSGLTLGRASVAGPVGIDRAPDGKMWIAEMGASSVSQIEHQTGRLERFPTTHSPYYPTSGPAGLHVEPSGAVWFIEHFADRVSRLDPNAKTLHEYEVPSAPGTNVQFLAPAEDGSVWFAEFSRNKIGRTTFTNEPVLDIGPANITLAAGSSATFDLADVNGLGASVTAAGPVESINATIEGGKLVVRAAANAPITQAADGGNTGVPDHYVLLAVDHGTYTSGRYIPVTITEAANETPGVPVAALVATLGLIALARKVRA